MSKLLEVSDLSVAFGQTHAVRGVSFSLEQGQTLAIVGESGSGKSLSSLAILGLLPPQARVVSGSIRWDGRELLSLGDDELRKLRGEELAIIFQDPLSALNPSLTVGYQIAEMFRRRRGARREEARRRAIEAMTEVGIPDAARRAENYPHEFSGGMRQRVMIAMALALEPRLLIADEPTTALDVTVQAQILRLLRKRQEAGLSMIIISHDLGVVARTAQRVVVMYAGKAVESGTVAELYSNPSHPYTKGLLAASPSARDTGRQIQPIDGYPPDITAMPSGCAFHPRCPFARERCRTDEPELRIVAPGRTSACHFAEEVLTHGEAVGNTRA
ncbi:ABC transporter ATP-binding protein [Saccharomonospora viridis]|jgi:oligopeptide transport system ATP-binding protein|uniref:Oligopeptide/dipeptide ABC transporter, ATP-binding protein n=2 Tax=Saccharomonospora viridis TaxID=1852 RepID=C7MPX2_SACVD|nr:ABC transporter ATP-binding protein [Saccharomonospora viridis]ACU96367.1 oligopeptide/dipeptide ABC transporter, ATP-binding protein [Saccharomonospora viridis DSM 43017]KHF42502.1 peptide ABC transporter ATP-binding protein [Saccharomonospora viridis]SFO98226.1 oligopeptide transport system ATP-binding protein [Saccharomonospora viridis]